MHLVFLACSHKQKLKAHLCEGNFVLFIMYVQVMLDLQLQMTLQVQSAFTVAKNRKRKKDIEWQK